MFQFGTSSTITDRRFECYRSAILRLVHRYHQKRVIKGRYREIEPACIGQLVERQLLDWGLSWVKSHLKMDKMDQMGPLLVYLPSVSRFLRRHLTPSATDTARNRILGSTLSPARTARAIQAWRRLTSQPVIRRDAGPILTSRWMSVMGWTASRVVVAWHYRRVLSSDLSCFHV